MFFGGVTFCDTALPNYDKLGRSPEIVLQCFISFSLPVVCFETHIAGINQQYSSLFIDRHTNWHIEKTCCRHCSAQWHVNETKDYRNLLYKVWRRGIPARVHVCWHQFYRLCQVDSHHRERGKCHCASSKRCRVCSCTAGNMGKKCTVIAKACNDRRLRSWRLSIERKRVKTEIGLFSVPCFYADSLSMIIRLRLR